MNASNLRRAVSEKSSPRCWRLLKHRTKPWPSSPTVQEWIAVVGAKTAYIERGSPWENGYIESFNARLRDEVLNGEIFYTLREAQIVIERAGDATTTRSGPTLNRIQATSNISAAAYAPRRWHPADDTARLLQVLHERRCQHRDGGQTRPRSERGLPERGAAAVHPLGSLQ